MIGDAAVHHSARVSSLRTGLFVQRQKTPHFPVGDSLLCESTRLSGRQARRSASKVFWAGGGIATFPGSERPWRSLCKTFQARNRLCFDASSSSSKSWIAFGVIDIGQGFMRTLRRPNHLQLLRASSSDSVYKLSDPNSRGQNSA